MKRILLSMVVWAMGAVVPSLGQSVSPTIYAESFRQGSTRITEEAFDAKLTPDNATYRERIKDSLGNDRYELTITPEALEGTNHVLAREAQGLASQHLQQHSARQPTAFDGREE
jgi:hypothetical protein